MDSPTTEPTVETIDHFIAEWRNSGGGETANFQSFVRELCALIEVDPPQPTQTDDEANRYVFEKSVHFNDGGSVSTKRADLFKAGCFVCEAKQGSDPTAQGELFGGSSGHQKKGTAVRGTKGWDRAMVAARNQADRYARFLGWPPFLIVVDVGHVIELFADFSGSGQNAYTPFPDPSSHRIRLDDLHRPAIRERLRQVWLEPHGLDPSKHAARVTREVAAKLAELARSLEADGRAPGAVSEFLMRCLFTMFAEDVGLLPADGFTKLLEEQRKYLAGFAPAMEQLWRLMNDGGPSPQLKETIRRFNGALFRNATAMPLNGKQLDLLIEAAKADWSSVEPAIFGTLLERALDPRERHKLGAHYTPRAYVERLVMPTIIEPLRDEWATVQATAMQLEGDGKHAEALDELRGFHRKLCHIRVLDPACGSGNFLYVTMEHMKRLEGEVIDVLGELDAEAARLELQGLTVTPEQFLGIELNERAAVIAEMVLWIGFLQWHFRTSKNATVPTPVLRNYGNIECRDAVLAWDDRRLKVDETGKPITHWDGRTTKPHPVTGREVPDESAQVEDYEYINPRPAEWPKADYVVGNPPFVGNKRMRSVLGDGYVDAIRGTLNSVSKSADYVMYWWDKAADLACKSKIKSFGLITTNSITQPFNRKTIEQQIGAKNGINILFAVPDHPWVDSSDGANVRIAMSVGTKGNRPSRLLNVEKETTIDHGEVQIVDRQRWGRINANLTVGPDVSQLAQLRSNSKLASQGMTLVGEGFRLSKDEIRTYGVDPAALSEPVKKYMIGKDLTQIPIDRYVIDFFGMNEHQARELSPSLFQHLYDYVKPERNQNNRKSYREKWWIFAEPRAELRSSIKNLSRYVSTCRTAKHRVFSFLDCRILPDAKIVGIGLDDASFLGTLSSRPHVLFAMETGGWLGVGNDSNYNHADCFAKFPFPDPPEPLKAKIRALGEELDSHRKARQAAHPDLTMTQMYNVLEALRERRALTDKERAIHEKGLVSVLKDIHDRLDAAVIEAYGWPADISDDEILERLVALNKERAAEEVRGLVRWLRPDYQNPTGRTAAVQTEMETGAPAAKATAKVKWPATLPEQVRAMRDLLDRADAPLDTETVAAAFARAPRGRVSELLQTLASLGQARATEDGRYAAR